MHTWSFPYCFHPSPARKDSTTSFTFNFRMESETLRLGKKFSQYHMDRDDWRKEDPSIPGNSSAVPPWTGKSAKTEVPWEVTVHILRLGWVGGYRESRTGVMHRFWGKYKIFVGKTFIKYEKHSIHKVKNLGYEVTRGARLPFLLTN